MATQGVTFLVQVLDDPPRMRQILCDERLWTRLEVHRCTDKKGAPSKTVLYRWLYGRWQIVQDNRRAKREYALSYAQEYYEIVADVLNLWPSTEPLEIRNPWNAAPYLARDAAISYAGISWGP